MARLFDRSAPKRAANLSVNSDLLDRCRAQNVNLSATLERALEAELARSEAEKWKADNKAAIHAYNEFVEEHGCFGDKYRVF